jgi:hypothetical protein
MCVRHPRKEAGMTRERIIRLARDADRMLEWVLEFEELVARDEREQIALMIERIDLTGLNDWPDWQRFIAELLATTAELIRTRGKE